MPEPRVNTEDVDAEVAPDDWAPPAPDLVGSWVRYSEAAKKDLKLPHQDSAAKNPDKYGLYMRQLGKRRLWHVWVDATSSNSSEATSSVPVLRQPKGTPAITGFLVDMNGALTKHLSVVERLVRAEAEARAAAKIAESERKRADAGDAWRGMLERLLPEGLRPAI